MFSESILTEWRNLLGEENVIADPQALEPASKTNYPTQERISLILKPGNSEELSQCMKLAQAKGLHVYVISKGKNWGYGSKVPVQDQAILIELDRMNRIIDFNEQLGYITVEPGVTFQQAFDFLRSKNSELLLGTTGGPVDSSIIGNTMERGIGTGLYADRSSFVCGFEVVLPDGKIINTGFERFPNSNTGKLSRWGLGPSLDGLFAQSNLGIVTRMTVWLLKCPAFFQIGFYKIADSEKLSQVLNRLQGMAMDGLIRPALTLYNDLRILSCVMQFPFDKMNPGTLDQEELMSQLRAASPLGNMVGPWNGEISIRAVDEEHAQIHAKLIEENLRDLVYDFSFVSASKQEILSTLQKYYETNGNPSEAPNLKSFLMNKYIGIPSNAAIGYAYWRKRTPMPPVMDPDGDHCGLFWFSPVIPFNGEDITKAVGIIKSTVQQYRFEAAVSLQCISERSVHIIASINWDRDVEGEDELAVACYEAVNAKLKEAGYYSYRDSTFHMKEAQEQGDYEKVLQAIKKTFDPEGILSPGRYIPS